MVSQASQSRIRYKRQFVEVQYFLEHLDSDVSIEMMLIPGGTFQMGSPEQEEGRQNREGPVHRVTVPEFCMGKYPITQAQWRYVAGLEQVERGLSADPSKFKGDDRPVEKVSWYDAVEFCDRLARETGRSYRLPSEAEWEYACRAGTTTPYHFGETITTDLANYSQEYKGTTPVEKFGIANAFGLCEMHGNMWEWCFDHYGNYSDTPTDGSAYVTENNDASRVLRGGSWDVNPRDCRSAYRNIFLDPSYRIDG